MSAWEGRRRVVWVELVILAPVRSWPTYVHLEERGNSVSEDDCLQQRQRSVMKIVQGTFTAIEEHKNDEGAHEGEDMSG